MESVEKVTSVVMQKCNDGLKLIFSNGSDTVYVTMDWVEAAKMTMRLDEQGTEAHTMMQMGLDPYRGDHRQSYTFAGFQAGSE